LIGLFEQHRGDVIAEARRQSERGHLVIKDEFKNLFNNPIWPLQGAQRLLARLETPHPINM